MTVTDSWTHFFNHLTLRSDQDILWDLGYATSWAETNLLRDDMYNDKPPVDALYDWRDARDLDECHWYG